MIITKKVSLGESGKLVMATDAMGKAAEGGGELGLEKYYGEKGQLWHYKERVAHSSAAKKRFKVMKFDGTLLTTVRLPNFISIPTKEISMAVWFKGNKGTPFSYASKRHVDALVITNPRFLSVYIMDKQIITKLNVGNGAWNHVAVTWKSQTGHLVVYVNGHKKFEQMKVMKGKTITPGGCMLL